MKKQSVCISNGNNKMGKTPNISLPPITTCGKNLPCFKKCYALKSYRLYKNVKTAWNKNLAIYQNNPADYFNQIDSFLTKKKPVFFRFHVSGDFVDIGYLMSVFEIAIDHPKTCFLAFSKKYGLVNNALEINSYQLPENLSLVFSGWHGLGIDNPHNLPVAWCKDENETRIPADAIKCFGNCETCGMCWNLRTIGKDVFFEIH